VAGEQSIINSGLNYTIIRPSLAFGSEDEFFNRLAGLVRGRRSCPWRATAELGSAVWVEDVATCIIMPRRKASTTAVSSRSVA
jgi:NADH dehydrogenase